MGDQIQKDGTAASISETLNNRILIAYKRCKDILNICKQPCLIGFHTATGLVEQFKKRMASQLSANSESWIGLTQTHVDRLQKVQDDLFIEMF